MMDPKKRDEIEAKVKLETLSKSDLEGLNETEIGVKLYGLIWDHSYNKIKNICSIIEIYAINLKL